MVPVLEMKQITKRFPGVVALNKFSIDVRAGEVHALVGENGAGKSTLIKTLYGVHQPDEGSIYLNGSQILIKNEADAISKGIGVVFQELNVCPHLDVANNIFLGCIKNKHGVVDDRWTYRETQRILRETVKLDVDPATPMKYLSIAEQQMVEIAKVVSKGCKIIVFDEPTSSLTENEIVHLFGIIHQLKQNGVGIIYISHRLEELEQIADRVTVIRDGQHIKTMDYKDADTDTIVSLMVGREVADIYPKYRRKIGDVIFEANNIRYVISCMWITLMYAAEKFWAFRVLWARDERKRCEFFSVRIRQTMWKLYWMESNINFGILPRQLRQALST